MECRASMRIGAFLCVVLISSFLSGPVAARELVLVAKKNFPEAKFNKTELRRLFLGFSIYKDGEVVSALRNKSSEEMDRVFMQHVMFMSRKSYERRLLSLKFKKGNRDIKSLDTTDEIFASLTQSQYSVSYVWRDELTGRDDYQVIQTLWKGDK